MSENLNAEVISIGTEILLGEITDTNSVYMAQVLRDLGINLYFMTSVGDNEQRIASAIHIALSRADIVITCGGLGPTVDDMTRQAVARATNRELVFHQDLLDQIAERFAGFKMRMTENNRRQAYLPANAIKVENPVGTAPSFIVEHEGKYIISLPGVPREMKFLLKEKIVPFLQERFRLGVIKAHILKAAGIGESSLDDLIGKDLLELSNPTVGLAAHQGQVDIRITAKAETVEQANAMIAEIEAQVRGRAGKYIFGMNSDTLEDILVKLLHEQQGTLAISETGLNGALSTKIKSLAHGNDVLTFAEEFTNPGALFNARPTLSGNPLREASAQLAEHICREYKATVALAVICHPDIDENADTTQGTAVAVYTPENVRSRIYGFGGKSELAVTWVTSWAFSAAWQMLQEKFRA